MALELKGHVSVFHNPKISRFIKVIDADTGELIHGCFEADTITGKYKRYIKNDSGKHFVNNNEVAFEEKNGNIRIELS